MKTLIAHDQIEILQLLQHELKREGAEVEHTTSAVNLLRRLKGSTTAGKPCDLLLLDLTIPEVDAFELLKQIGEAGLALHVIVIAGCGDEDKAIEAIRLGAIDYLLEPISLGALRTALFRVRQRRAAEGKETFKHRILVVDDEKGLADRIKQDLDREGYEPAVAYDGVGGLEYFKNNRVDVVIADITMPGMNGLEMVDKCRAINPDCVSIIVTGFSDNGKAIRSLRLGVFDYLRKPISVEELRSVVKEAVGVVALRRGVSACRRELEIEFALKTQYAQKLERERRFPGTVAVAAPAPLPVADRDLGRVLIIESNQEVADSLCLCLKLVWPRVNTITTGEAVEGIELMEAESPDLVILCLELPDREGFDLLAEIRSNSEVPIIVLSTRQSEMDKARALETGADDYITKPFSPIDLLARVRAVLRHGGMHQLKGDSSIFVSGNLTISLATHDVVISGNHVKLSPLEYNLLCNLVRNEGKVISHRSLLVKVWGPNYADDTDFLKKYIYRLRVKLNDNDPSRRMLVCVPGVGYKFVRIG
ncbi:response regulator [Dehalococcoidia bacterium]|nr:response regulator [Dehalococcoidia bacterium]